MLKQAARFYGFFLAMLVVATALTACGGGNVAANEGGAVTSHVVIYAGNGSVGGTVPNYATGFTPGQTIVVLGNPGNLVRPGYVLAGWNTQSDGNGTTYAPGQTFAMGDTDVILYARWTQNPTYSVTYFGNGSTGGSAPVDSGHYEQNQTATILGNTGGLTKSGYSFVGWNTRADGSGTSYMPAQSFPIGSANVSLYAIWTANPTYTVTYVGNGNTGGSAPMDSVSYEQNQTVTVLGNSGNLVKAGYTFAGWNTQADGNGITYTLAQSFAMGSANVGLYAIWTANPTYTVAYNGNGNTGGTVPVDSTHYESGQLVTVLGNTGNLTKSGYGFIGWNTASNGAGTSYAPATTFSMGSANVTLFASWDAVPQVTATTPANGGSASAATSVSVTFSQPMDLATLTAQTTAGTCSGSLQISLDNFGSCIALASTAPTLSGDKKTATVVPQPGLLVNRVYKIRVSASASDVAGTALGTQYTSITGFTTTSPISATVNETGGPLEAQYCALSYPLSITAAVGTAQTVYGLYFESGTTDLGSIPIVSAQLGYGPRTANPEYESGWNWFNATYNGPNGANAEYKTTIVAPLPGAYAYAYRFSRDAGSTWTYCGSGGAGSLGGFHFDLTNLGVMAVVN